jgi:hypothetical protein
VALDGYKPDLKTAAVLGAAATGGALLWGLKRRT